MEAKQAGTGAVVVVTGACGDIGMAIVSRCLAEGCRVAALDRDARRLRANCEAQDAAADALLALQCDVSDEAATLRATEAIMSRWGQLRILVNNAAGVTPTAVVGELTSEQWRQTLDINLTGAWLMARAVLPHMLHTGGVVLNIASQLGHVGASGRGAYGVSKAGLLALTRAIAVDYADHGIRALSLSPGAVLTGRVIDRYGGVAQAGAQLAHKYPLGRLGTPAEVAEAAWFLVSGRCGFMTGTDLLMDGGYTAI
jgi:NAD(P)-dependent dehydrogenase (short-subunit alcohol dehydrogenase family)